MEVSTPAALISGSTEKGTGLIPTPPESETDGLTARHSTVETLIIDGGTLNERTGPLMKHLEDRKAQGKRELVRLVGILIILILSIVALAFKVQPELFISLISLLIGVLLDSPLTARTNGAKSG